MAGRATPNVTRAGTPATFESPATSDPASIACRTRVRCEPCASDQPPAMRVCRCIHNHAFQTMREAGVEPARLAALDPKSSASANFATLAHSPAIAGWLSGRHEVYRRFALPTNRLPKGEAKQQEIKGFIRHAVRGVGLGCRGRGGLAVAKWPRAVRGACPARDRCSAVRI